MREVRIAAAQSAVSIDPAENGTEIRALMRMAAAAGARLVHFPEGAVSGYAGQDKPHFRGWQIDWQPVGQQLTSIAELAAELGLWVVVGGNHRLTPPNRPHNSLYVISDRGVVDRYDKRLLSYSEVTDFYAPGSRPVVFEVGGFRFGLALCIEVNFPELFVEYRDRYDVDCMLFSTFSEDPVFEVIARGHAAACNLWLSISVPAQCSPAMPAAVLAPNGSWLQRCPADGTSALAVADLDRDDPALEIALNRARPWRRTSRDGSICTAHHADGDPRSTNRSTF